MLKAHLKTLTPYGGASPKQRGGGGGGGWTLRNELGVELCGCLFGFLCGSLASDDIRLNIISIEKVNCNK